LKRHIRVEAKGLPGLLRNDGRHRRRLCKALLAMSKKCTRQLKAMGRLREKPLVPIEPDELRDRLLVELATLETSLEEGSEAERAAKLCRTKVLCQHLLALTLGLIVFFGCPICQDEVVDQPHQRTHIVARAY